MRQGHLYPMVSILTGCGVVESVPCPQAAQKHVGAVRCFRHSPKYYTWAAYYDEV